MGKKKTPIPMPADRKTAAADAFVKGSRSPADAAGKMKRLTLDVTEDLHRRIKGGCNERGKLMADVLREILEKEFPR